MRLYSESGEEAVCARQCLNDWLGEGVIDEAQYRILQQDTVSNLRTTNVFLRLVLFLFTLISLGAIAALFVVVFLSPPSSRSTGIFLLIFSAICYAAAEIAASRFRLYRYGIEEALLACSVGFLCAGMLAALFGDPFSSSPGAAVSLVPAVGAVFSLWIWRRFGLWYAFPAAMIFVVFLPGYWTLSHAARHLIIVAIFTAGLICFIAAHSRRRFDYLDAADSLAEAFLWLGSYVAINLQLSSFQLLGRWWYAAPAAPEFAAPFYWTTWALIWCLPPIVLARGVRRKNRFVIAAGAIAAILTLVTNKPYLGWPRHTWDPMLLGILLAGVAFFLRRWLASGPDGIRRGFTAARLSAKDRQWIDAGATVLGALSPGPVTPGPQGGRDFRFGGGQSGGGGAGGTY